ncbi:MAG TPA: PIG-L family deacetylase, partial [Thermogutta sp.]|nr:PIG-L family deacetylase [Thermogutta sp.]
MAHPDDAEFCCGGTLARLRELGWEVHIASLA